MGAGAALRSALAGESLTGSPEKVRVNDGSIVYGDDEVIIIDMDG
jgi:hypothetical protein